LLKGKVSGNERFNFIGNIQIYSPIFSLAEVLYLVDRVKNQWGKANIVGERAIVICLYALAGEGLKPCCCWLTTLGWN